MYLMLILLKAEDEGDTTDEESREEQIAMMQERKRAAGRASSSTPKHSFAGQASPFQTFLGRLLHHGLELQGLAKALGLALSPSTRAERH